MPDLNKLAARSVSDVAFRRSLLSSPATVLSNEGFTVPANARIEVIESQPNEIHLQIGEQGRPAKLQALLDRAQGDAEFRRQFVQQSNRMFEEASGQSLPAGAVVRVHEPLDGLRIVLPPLQAAVDTELSEADLETVAGGGFFKNVVGGIREWLCKDTRISSYDENLQLRGTVLLTSHGEGLELRPSNPTL